MATLALSVAGQFAGGLVGGPIGATVGRALGALAGSTIDSAIFGSAEPERVPADLQLQGSSEGGAIPRVYGWCRIAGNIIWATHPERVTENTSGGKGTAPEPAEEQLLANFAVGLCEGEISRIGRIWADGHLLETDGLQVRVYRGTEDQERDPLIAAKQGEDATPAYRGLCYIVFEALPLGQFGNRIPNISVEIVRAAGDLEPNIRAVTVIPGATEFGYDPEPRVRLVSAGVTALENTHLLGRTSNWTLSIDELQAFCPNLEHVALVVAWFGDDLRCGQCRIRPRVEGASRSIEGTRWIVSGQERQEAPVVSRHAGGPAFGGSPSDSSVLAAIADLKARGLKVTLHPFILMDIPGDNDLPDPYSGTPGQPAYPWRGRVTCDPAPGMAGSPDGTAGIVPDIAAFAGTATAGQFVPDGETVRFTGGVDWGVRRFILHYARLADMAGGVDAIFLGSELRGMTILRDAPQSFPFVDALVDLAAEVRSIVGSSTRLTYGADWAEYSGYQPAGAPGDKLFHLDPLWASADIDAVGIDNYMPLADWRGSGRGPDAAIATSPYELSYLGANITGGEGYDWYYASAEDRRAGIRSPIDDATHGEDWIWRYKDIVSWWRNANHNRVGGVRQPDATGWVPQSKPVWFAEIGCAAVDKGANQPNIFGDPKSAEDGRPYFSKGTSDALMQRQFLRAHQQHWIPAATGFADENNPFSSVYEGRMVDPDRLYVWTWDARPYPAFPQRTDIWSDGPNHAIGHWLTGRLGIAAPEEFVRAIARDYGVQIAGASSSGGMVEGLVVPRIGGMRDAVEPLAEACGLGLRDTPDGVEFFDPAAGDGLAVNRERLAASDGPVVSRIRPNTDERIGILELSYADKGADYRSSVASAVTGSGPSKAGVSTNLVFEGGAARRAAERVLRSRSEVERLEAALPPSLQALEVGDRLSITDLAPDAFSVEVLRIGRAIALSATRSDPGGISSFAAQPASTATLVPNARARPVAAAAHIPGAGGDVSPTRIVPFAFADPWPGSIAIRRADTGGTFARLDRPLSMGVLGTDLGAGPIALWDRAARPLVTLFEGQLSAATGAEVLAGVNRMLVQHDDGEWEVIGFERATLVAENSYELGGLLRGLEGTDHALDAPASAGATCLPVTSDVTDVPVEADQLDQVLGLLVVPGGEPGGQPLDINLTTAPALPLAPVHARARRPSGGADVHLSWIRRTRIGGDNWTGPDVALDFVPEHYRLRIFDGASELRGVDLAAPAFVYTSVMQDADGVGPATELSFVVRQQSAVLGEGHPAHFELVT